MAPAVFWAKAGSAGTVLANSGGNRPIAAPGHRFCLHGAWATLPVVADDGGRGMAWLGVDGASAGYSSSSRCESVDAH